MERKKQRKSSNSSKTSTKKRSNRISIFTILLILVIIAVSIGIYFGVRALVITLKYKQYTDKMNTYGFSELYDNDKATATDKVTNAELLKVVMGSLNNAKDVSQVYYLADKNLSENKNWYNYSLYLGVNNVITEKELDMQATKDSAVMLLVSVLESYLRKDINQTKLDVSDKKLAEYTKEEQEIISKAVTLGIIKNKSSELSDKEIIKGELNKLVIEAVEKNAIIYYKNTSSDKDSVTIVTDKYKMPENYKEYPYIVSNISKDIYEIDYKVRTQSSFKTPVQVYKKMGYLYGQTDELIVKYFNSILNIDYSMLTAINFLDSIGKIVTYKITEQDVQDYVQYVKNNKIKLEGKATPLLPIMYDNGEEYVVRTKITFKVLSSDTQKNLLFGDEKNNVTYNGKEFTMYVDLPMGMTFNSNSLLIKINCLAQNLIKPTNTVVVEE